MKAKKLISRLLETLDRREKDYLQASEKTNGETKVSFIARACEIGLFRDDLHMLLERLGKKKKYLDPLEKK